LRTIFPLYSESEPNRTIAAIINEPNDTITQDRNKTYQVWSPMKPGLETELSVLVILPTDKQVS